MDDEEALRAETRKLILSLNAGDVGWISSHYVPEVTRFHQRGRLDVGWTDAKCREMRRILDDGTSFEFSELEIVDVRIYGDVGITAGHLYSQVTIPGLEPVGGPSRFTYVWVKIGGRWKEAHHHVSDLREWGA